MNQEHTEQELRDTLRAMKELIARAKALAEPILARWQAEEEVHRQAA